MFSTAILILRCVDILTNTESTTYWTLLKSYENKSLRSNRSYFIPYSPSSHTWTNQLGSMPFIINRTFSLIHLRIIIISSQSKPMLLITIHSSCKGIHNRMPFVSNAFREVSTPSSPDLDSFVEDRLVWSVLLSNLSQIEGGSFI